MPKKDNKEKGRVGEEAARKYLESLGYQILESNYRCRFGEIDLIVREKEYTIFVEVKCRVGDAFGRPCEAVTKKKQNKIISVAKQYIVFKNLQNAFFRFDVIEVFLDQDKAEINHIPNAFW